MRYFVVVAFRHTLENFTGCFLDCFHDVISFFTVHSDPRSFDKQIVSRHTLLSIVNTIRRRPSERRVVFKILAVPIILASTILCTLWAFRESPITFCLGSRDGGLTAEFTIFWDGGTDLRPRLLPLGESDPGLVGSTRFRQWSSTRDVPQSTLSVAQN